MNHSDSVQLAFVAAEKRYAEIGVDASAAMAALDRIPVSMHCWQGDDVIGFESSASNLTGGIQTTGNYPGKARNAKELRQDLEAAMAMVPGPKRLNLHAIYLESEQSVERDKIKPEHFAGWVAWEKKKKVGLDFNPSCFSHPLSASGMSL